MSTDKIEDLITERDALRAEAQQARAALRLFTGAAIPCSTEIDARGYRWCEPYLDGALRALDEVLDAARSKT